MIENTDFIRTIDSEYSAEFKEKKSRFTGFCKPVPSTDAAEAYLKELQKKFYDANHHCYAFKINDHEQRYSDAGEPTGTAGRPIMNAIQHFSLYEIMIVVVRYFGGVKLGTGGLTRAYFQGAKMALESARIVKKILWETVQVEFDYQYTHLFQNLLSRFNGKPDNLVYDAKVHGSILILPSEKENFLKQVVEASANRIHIYNTGELS